MDAGKGPNRITLKGAMKVKDNLPNNSNTKSPPIQEEVNNAGIDMIFNKGKQTGISFLK